VDREEWGGTGETWRVPTITGSTQLRSLGQHWVCWLCSEDPHLPLGTIRDGEAAVLHNSLQWEESVCWEIPDWSPLTHPDRNWWCTPQRYFYLNLWVSARVLILWVKLFLFLAFLKCTSKNFAKWKKENKKRVDEGTLFWVSYKRDSSTEWKINLKA